VKVIVDDDPFSADHGVVSVNDLRVMVGEALLNVD
jgi:hypothetical protein